MQTTCRTAPSTGSDCAGIGIVAAFARVGDARRTLTPLLRALGGTDNGTRAARRRKWRATPRRIGAGSGPTASSATTRRTSTSLAARRVFRAGAGARGGRQAAGVSRYRRRWIIGDAGRDGVSRRVAACTSRSIRSPRRRCRVVREELGAVVEVRLEDAAEVFSLHRPRDRRAPIGMPAPGERIRIVRKGDAARRVARRTCTVRGRRPTHALQRLRDHPQSPTTSTTGSSTRRPGLVPRLTFEPGRKTSRPVYRGRRAAQCRDPARAGVNGRWRWRRRSTAPAFPPTTCTCRHHRRRRSLAEFKGIVPEVDSRRRRAGRRRGVGEVDPFNPRAYDEFSASSPARRFCTRRLQRLQMMSNLRDLVPGAAIGRTSCAIAPSSSRPDS